MAGLEDQIGKDIGTIAAKTLAELLPGMLSESLKGIFSTVMGNEAAKTLADAGPKINDIKNNTNEAKKAAIEYAKNMESARGWLEDIVGKELFVELEAETGKARGVLSGFMKSFKEGKFGELEAALELTGIDIDQGALKDGAKVIGDSLSKLVDLKSLGASFLAVAAMDVTKKARDGVATLTNQIMEIDRDAAQVHMGFVVPADTHADGEKAVKGVHALREASERYRAGLVQFTAQTGQGSEAFKTLGMEARNAGLDFGALEGTMKDGVLTGGLSMDHGSGVVKGMAAITTIARGAGVETADVMSDIALFTKTLGLEAEDAAKKYGLFEQVARGTKATTKEVKEGVMESVKALRFFGDTSNSVGSIYKNFLKALGTGKEGLAGELAAMMTQSLAKMDAGLKAFISTTGSFGGTGDMLGGVLEVEQAIMENRGGEVIDALTRKIEETTGSQLLTFQEAIDTGQQATYFAQRELTKDMFGIGSDAEANEFIKGLSAGMADLKMDETGIRAVVDSGREQVAMETSGPEAAANLALITEQLGLTKDASANLFSSSKTFLDGSDNLIKASNSLIKFVEDIGVKGANKDALVKEGGGQDLALKTGIDTPDQRDRARQASDFEADGQERAIAASGTESAPEAIAHQLGMEKPVEATNVAQDVRQPVDIDNRPTEPVVKPQSYTDSAASVIKSTTVDEAEQRLARMKEAFDLIKAEKAGEKGTGATGDIGVNVYIGNEQLRDIIKYEVSERLKKGVGRD